MSAWVVSNSHINAMVKLAVHGPSEAFWIPPCDVSDPQALGQSLWAENHKSVNARYCTHTRTPRFVYRPDAKTPNPVQALGVVACYSYQSSETRGWDTSGARSLCEALKDGIFMQQGWVPEQSVEERLRDDTWAWDEQDGEG